MLRDVTLVQPGRWRREHQSLVVRGGEIGAIGPALAQSEVSGGGDALRGSFVLPGFVDAHAHYPPASLPGQSQLFSFLFLYHGVTGVRDPGDIDGSAHPKARGDLDAGRYPGPRLLQCGYFVDGEPPIWRNTLVVRTPADAAPAVARIASEGYGCVKVYERLDGPRLAAIREAAREHGLPVIGHVPYAVPYEEARIDDAQHLIGVAAPSGSAYRNTTERNVDWFAVDEARMEAVAQAALDAAMANTPTLVTLDTIAHLDDYEGLRNAPWARLLPRLYRDVIWAPDSGVGVQAMPPEAYERLRATLPVRRAVVRRMYERGVELHSGTDTLVSFLVPGHALHRELRLLAEAGIPPEDVMRIATETSASVLATPGLGTLAVGAPADLVLFGSDPTRDLAALDDIRGVVRDGRFYSRERLDAQLERYRAHFEGPLYERLSMGIVRAVLRLQNPHAEHGPE